MAGTGSEDTRLIILRGNSASGKSSTAAEIRRRHGRRDLAIVGQDNLRREVLRERDVPGGANIGLVDLVARYALGCGFNVIVEGIFRSDHYAEMLRALIDEHQGRTHCYYLDVPLEPDGQLLGVRQLRGVTPGLPVDAPLEASPQLLLRLRPDRHHYLPGSPNSTGRDMPPLN